MEKQEYFFLNGFNAVLVPIKALPIVCVRGWVRGGSALDEQKWVGASVPAMLSKGTAMRSREEFEDRLDKYALEYSTRESGESCFFMEWNGRALRKYAGELLELAAESLRYPSFPNEELEILRARQIAKIRDRKSDPIFRAEDEVLRMIYGPRHPYCAMPYSESISQIRSVSRGDLLSFWEKHYSPNRAGVVLVGDIDPDDARDKLQQVFGSWRAVEKSDGNGCDETRNEYRSDRHEERVVFIPEKDSAILQIGQGVSVSSADPVYPALRVAVVILGGGVNSRLFQNVRGKHGLSYAVGASLNSMHTIPGYFSAFAHTNPNNIQKAQEAVTRVINEFWEAGITEEELEQAKQILRGHKDFQLSNLQGIAHYIVLSKIAGLFFDDDDIEKRVRRLGVREVNEAIHQHLDPSRMKIVRAGTVS